jgi:hypothetical protein
MSFFKVLFKVTITNNRIQLINITKKKLVGAIFLGLGVGYIVGYKDGNSALNDVNREQKDPEE